jgi:nitroimidazol reductase NimA-like FMN-containing flavoprotein (pyridoxamine 5'-phosphate oxidase superfamily)
MADGDQPLVNVNLFAFDVDRRAIYLHTARLGRTRETIEKNPNVCFVVSDMGRLLPAKEAGEFSVEYESVVVFGRASVVEDADEARHGLQLLLDRYAPHLRPDRDYRPVTDDELRRTSVFRVDVQSWSGKRKMADADFPGAFRFGEEDASA